MSDPGDGREGPRRRYDDPTQMPPYAPNYQQQPQQEATSWLKENSTLIYFLAAQLIAIGAAGASMLAYFTKLETRVSIMETRGAEYTVAIMAQMKERITIIEQRQGRNEAQIERLVNEVLKLKSDK